MANYYSDPLRPARPGRINAQVQPTRTYQGESLTPDYSRWMPGLGEYDRLQRNRAMGVPVGQYGPAFPSVPRSAPAGAAAPSPSSIGNGARNFFPGVVNPGVGNSLAPSPAAPGITSGVKPPPMPGAFPGAATLPGFGPDKNSDPFFRRDWGKMPDAFDVPSPPDAASPMPSTLETPISIMQRDDPLNDFGNSMGNGLQARALQPDSSMAERPHYTREQLAKMDADSLAALALWPRGPELQRQRRTNAASLPETAQATAGPAQSRRGNSADAQALAARVLRPRFGPGASSSAPGVLTRSGPRSREELAKLDPTTLAALALQPRGPLMKQQWQQQQAQKMAEPSQRRGGLGAASFTGTDHPNDKVPDNILSPEISSLAFGLPALPDSTFSIDPQSYLQPAASDSNGEKPTPPPAPAPFRPGVIADAPNRAAGWQRNDISHDSPLPDISRHFKEMAPGDPAGWRSDPARTSLAPSTGVQLWPNGLLTPPRKKFESWANNTDAAGNLITPSDRKTDALEYYLHVKPPHTLRDLEQARQEEISSSPTSAAYAAKLAQVAKDTGYTVNWQLNPDPKSHSSTTIPDHAHKQIKISISQNDLAGGTFGHESDHAIRMMLEGQATKENPPPPHMPWQEYAAYTKGIKDKVASDPFFQNNSSLDSRDDAMENQGTRVGNLIIAERLAQQHMDNKGVPLLERIPLPNSEMVTTQRLKNNNVKSKHENNLLPLPPGTEYGTHVLDTLRQKWEAEYRKLHPDR